MRAMILAAGRGERLRPLTDKIPKPLVEVNGKPLIVWHIEKLAAAGFKQFVINLCWLGEKIKQQLGNGSNWDINIEYSEESEALETAGGIIQALPVLGNKPFAVINSDIWSDFSAEKIMDNLQQLTDSEFLVKLMLVENPQHNLDGDFGLEKNTLQPYTEQQNKKHWTYAGIGFYKPEFFIGLERGKRAMPPLWTQGAQQKKISAEVFQGYWQDVGTLQRLAELEKHLQKNSSQGKNL